MLKVFSRCLTPSPSATRQIADVRAWPLQRRLRPMNERSPCDNQMAGCEAEPTLERPAGGACDRQFVAELGQTRSAGRSFDS